MTEKNEAFHTFTKTLVDNASKLNEAGLNAVSNEDKEKLRKSFGNLFAGTADEMKRISDNITKKRDEFDKMWKKQSPFSDDR